ncbi:hypothetical protein GCM10010512_00650 [Streptomyces thermoviolaceus subsp. thermoviolaceus]|uniref:alcohol dehydrogenase catalytic domain-containing protein n=1 Tax=Streptomyces thermoviolaceus TaxID=1952 RepID=UPI001673FD81|nr:alcohol dehydrogenase catalytic domain-containing protein [Streptomyces thermoviolaceus]WTD46084.1 alcohol dehydrogenase catalytic domain-containing protein [Streptomyces thermoviolaceus]GHA74365.1 hypothetical protein GCM10010512_00650 [Streptomyces thermoviolaceus subsp. thermoviolaceus]
MKAIVVSDQTAGTAGTTLTERPAPQPAINDVVVEIHASGFVPTEMEWPSTWTDRAGRDRAPSIPGHELAGVVTALGYGTTGLSVGQRVFGLADSLVSVVGPVEARPAEGLAIDFVVEADRAQLGEIVQRVRDGRLRTNIGTVVSLDDAVAAINATERRKGKTVVRVRP